MLDCIFCKIINNKIPSKKIYEDKDLLAFDDINKEADVHILLITKKHISTLNDLKKNDQNLMGKFMLTIPKIAIILGIKGFKTIINTGKEGGQVIFHIHAHILSCNKNLVKN